MYLFNIVNLVPCYEFVKLRGGETSVKEMKTAIKTHCKAPRHHREEQKLSSQTNRNGLLSLFQVLLYI